MNLLLYNVNSFALFILAILIALTFHEAAHGLVAHWLGDPTAKQKGRVTLNPIKHLDLWGSILFLIAGIGWGKPVPVNPQYFKNPKRDHALVAIAGPASNFLIAALVAIPFKLTALTSFHPFMGLLIDINVLLCALNLIPIPPLDGSKILAIILPKHKYYKYTRFLETNLAYIIIFFFFDIYFLQRWTGTSIINEILTFMTGIIKTIIFLGT